MPRFDVKSSRQEHLQEFFRRYASFALDEDPTKLAEFYDASFLAAGPRGGAAFKNDEAFLAWLRELHAFNVKVGMTSMTVEEVCEVPVGAGYTLATVTWGAAFQRTGPIPIRFKISYLLRESEAHPKVAANISHEDQEEVMRARGLL